MEHLTIKKLVTMAAISTLLTSCYYDVEEEIYTSVDCNIEMMSFQNDILPILQSNCYECHSAENNFGNITLEGYNNTIKYVNTGQLEGAINHEPGYSPMPKNKAQLITCNIEKIESWIIDGAPNN